MFQETTKISSSLAGSWGESQQQQQQRLSSPATPDSVQNVSDFYLTTTKDVHSDKYIKCEKVLKENKFAKYKKLKDSSPMMLRYGEAGVPSSLLNTANMSSNHFSSRPSTGMSSNSNNNKSNNNNGNTMMMMDRLWNYSVDEREDPYFTESSLILGKPLSRQEIIKSREAFHASNAPIAMGRSGKRVEKGLSTTGLSGERLMVGNIDRSKNSLIQRTWLYNDDPALKYKIQGIPKASMPTDVSLPIGQFVDHDPNAHYIKAGADFRRKQLVTYNALSRGTQCGSVFMDYPDRGDGSSQCNSRTNQ